MLGFGPLASSPLGTQFGEPTGTIDLVFNGQGLMFGSTSASANSHIQMAAVATLKARGVFAPGTSNLALGSSATLRTRKFIQGTTTLDIAAGLTLFKKNSIRGTSGTVFASNPTIKRGTNMPGVATMGFQGSAVLTGKRGLFGTTALTFTHATVVKISTSGTSALQTQTNGNIRGTAGLVSSVGITTGSAARLMSKRQLIGETSLGFALDSSIDKFNFDMVLGDLDPISDANPRVYSYVPYTPFSFFLIQTTNRIDRVENVYAAILNKTTGVWDRILILTGNTEYSNAISFSAGFDGNHFSCSVQMSNIRVIPQQARNVSFTFTILEDKLYMKRETTFDQDYTIPSEFWKSPRPFIMSNSGDKFAIWLSASTNVYEFYHHEGYWRKFTPMYNSMPLLVTEVSSAGFNRETEQLEFVGNNGNLYVSSSGYLWY